MRSSKLITSNPQIVSGTPVFKGTRVPVRTFWDYLDEGQSINSFLEDFPTVKSRQIHQLLLIAKQQTTTSDYGQIHNSTG